MSLLFVTPCAHCGSQEEDYLFHVDGRSVWRCRACRLVYLLPQLSGAAGGLETCGHPGDYLLQARERAGAQGSLSLSCQDAGSPEAHRLGYRWSGYQGRNFVFDQLSLQNLLAKAGFEAVEIGREPGQLRVQARVAARLGQPRLSVIVPVYNEASSFPTLIAALQAKQVPGLEKELVIVESGSTDGTHQLVQALEGRPGIRVIFEERPRGKGHAVRQGLALATGDWILIQDGDLEYDLDDYDSLLEPLKAYQQAFVLGSRYVGDWKIRSFIDQPFAAFVLNWGHLFFTKLLNLACGSHLKDPFTMFKVFRRDCLHGLEFKANRFDFDFELMIKLLRKGYQPLEVPVNYRSRSFKEGKKVRVFYDPMTWIWALIRFRFSPLYKK
jgi:hypothetical protein